MAGREIITRRVILKGAAAISLVPAAAKGVVITDAPSPTEALFAEWWSVYRRDTVDDADLQRQCDQLAEIEDRLFALPTVEARDAFMKITILDEIDNLSTGTTVGAALAREARAALGMPKPRP